MSRILTTPTQPLGQRQVLFNRSVTQKILLALLLAALAAIPLWLGLERAHSAPSVTASPQTSPTPSVTIAAPGQALIGTQVKFKVTFTNGTALGYGPFLDVVLDAGGKDGGNPPCTCDGITFVRAQMVGVNGGPIPLTPFSALTAPCGSAPNPITHPFASSGVLPVTVPAGGQLITLALPFGSFQPNQPPIEVEITANISLNADAGHPLNIFARGGFRFGTLTPLDDPSPSDPPVFSDEDPLGNQVVNSQAWIEKKTITPAVMIINKKYLGPEGENATGPNFIGYYPLRYELTVDIAPGQTIANVVLTDCLPDNMAFHQLVSVTPAGTSTLPPSDIPSPSGCLTVNWSSLTGSAAVVFEFFIPEKDAQGHPVLPADCTPAISKDTLKIEADWIPVDPCDGPLQHLSPPPLVDILLDKCIAIQKSVDMFTDTGAALYTPGDTVEYTLNFQISDYKTFSAVDITDSLGDGQKLVGPAPTLVVKDQFGTVSGSFVLGSDLISAPYNGNDCGRAIGGTKLTFLVSQRMISLAPPNPRHAAGILTGGFATTPSSSTPATGQIVFHAEILDEFAVTQQPGDKFVDKEDPLSNCVVIGGKLMTNVDPPALPTSTGVDGHDDSSKTISIVGDTLKKTVYAVKRANTFGVFNAVCGPPSGPGGTSCSNFPDPPQEVRPGDQVTYRLEKTIPSSDAENLTIEDWLPLPTFTVSSADTFIYSACGIPAPGKSCFGPLDQMHALLPLKPSFWAITATNGIKFDYPTTIQDPTNTPRKIDLLFTYTVTNLPFADELFLTNEARERETNTFGDPFPQAAIAQVNLRQPNLRVHKGTIATNNGFGTFTHQGPQTPTLSLAQAPTGATFSLLGVSGTVNHAAVAAGLMDSNVSNVDANDTVTFAITIENLGGAPAYDVKIEDIIPNSSGNPSCFTIVPNSIVVKRGTGVPVLPILYSIQPTNPGSTTTSFTITSTPNLPILISAFNAASGANIVTITFRAKLLANVMPGCCDNTVNLLHYSSTLNGPDFVAANLTPPFTDTATVCVNPVLTKSLVTTSEAHTSGSNVTIGEIARYRLAIQLPETGLLPNFEVTDALPAGLEFLPDGTARIAFVSNQAPITRTPQLSPFAYTIFGNSLPPSAVLTTRPPIPSAVFPGVGGCGSPFTFKLGNVKNNDSDNDLEYIVIEFNALVCNVMGNQNGTTLPNTFSVSSNGNLIATSNSPKLLVVEPNLAISKVASPATVAQGGTVTYTVTITNTGTADAFDVNFTDTLPSGLTFVPFSVGGSGSCLPFWGVSAGAPWVTCARVPANGVVTITYKAVAKPPLPCATCLTTLTNHATVTWTSLPGNGTPVGVNNTTGSITPGASGLVDGERNGVTPPLTLNDYAATASAPLTVTGPPCAEAPQGMVAWWKLDETAGTLVADIAGSNTGTTMPGAINLGGPNSLQAEVNNGFLFCGQPAARFVTVADQPALNFGTAQSFSIDAWIKTSSTSQFQMIVDKLNWPNPNVGYRFYVDNINRLKFDIGPGASFTSANPVVLTPGTWYHVAVTVGRANPFVTFYVNGTPDQAAGTATNNFNASSPGLNLLIGGTHETQLVPLEACNYMLDEVEIFNRALAQPEIDRMYRAGCTGKCKATISGLKFNDLNGNGVRDTGEPGLPGWTIKVTDSNGNTQTTATDFQGNYSITVPAPGTYTVAEVLQSGWTQTAPTSGTYSVTVSPGQVVNSRDFGNKLQDGPGACAMPPPGMVGWWPMDDPTGGTVVNDIAGAPDIGSPKPGLTIGPPSPASLAAVVGTGLNFLPSISPTGPSHYVEVPTSPEMNFGTGDFSIDAWIKLNQASNVHPIVDKLDFSTPGTNKGYVFFEQGGHLLLRIGPDVGGGLVADASTGPVITPGVWHHVAVTVRRNDPGNKPVITFYINGVLSGSGTPPGPLMPGSISIDGTTPLWIGGNSRLAGGGATISLGEIAIDELEFFKREISQTEIQRVVNARSAGKCKCLTATNEKITCNTNGTFSYTLTVKNLSSSTASYLTFSPVTSNVTITPASMTIPPLAPGGSTNVTVTIGGPGAVSGASVCFFVGLGASSYIFVGCRTEHCITLPTCPATCPFIVGHAPDSSTIPTFDIAAGTTTAQFVTGASDSRGRGVEVVGGLACWNTTVVYYTSISGDIHVAPYAGGSGGPDITVLPNPRQSGNGIQDLDYANGILYAMTGYNQGNGAVPIVYSLNPCTGAILSSVNLVSSSRNSDGFTVLPTGDFLINDGDGSKTYRAYSSTNGAPTGLVITLSASNATGVDYNPSDNSLYFFANFGGSRELARTDLSGNPLGTVPVNWTGSFNEDISVLCGALPTMTGSLKVTKTVKNLWAMPFPAGTNFPITVSCLPSGPNVTLNLAAGGTQTVNNIPVGSTCTVTEGALPPPIPHPACPSLEWGTPAYAPGQTVTIPSTGGLQTVTVSNTYFCNTTPGCATPPAGMVAWWPLDETSGNIVHSIVGNHDGITQSGPIGTGGLSVASAPKVGSALFFGAAKAEVPDDPALNFGTGDLSIDAWVRSSQSTLLSSIVDKLATSTTTHRGYAFFVRNGMVQLVIGDGLNTATYQSSNTFVADGTWRHVAVTMRRVGGSPVGQFYIDGVPAGGPFTPLAINVDSSAKLLIGNYRLGNDACSCEVSLDEIELFNTALTPNAIKAIFQADKKGKCKATITGSKFNDLNGNGVRNTGEPSLANWTIKVTDSSGNTQTTTTDSAGNYSLTVSPGTYTVAEVLQSGWTQTAPTSGTYAVTVSGSQVVNNRDFGNKKQATGSLTVTKTVENLSRSPIPAGTSFPITASCLPSGPNVTLNLAAGGTQTLNNIPVGSKCTVSEGPLPAPISSPVCGSLQWSAPTYSPGQSVTIPNSGAPQTITIQNRLICLANHPVDEYAFRRGMNEFCIWGGGGSFNSPRQINNPDSQFGFYNSPTLTGNTGGVRYGALGLCYGRILSANDKVALKYTFNAIPIDVISYSESNFIQTPQSDFFRLEQTRRNVFGPGLSPIGLQLYFRPQRRIKPFVNTSGGFIFFKDQVPRLNGARFNFTYDFGGGVQVFRDSRRAFNFGYKYQRISNGGRALNNPGFDGHVFSFGYSIFSGQKIDQSPRPEIKPEKIGRAIYSTYESGPTVTPSGSSGGPIPVPLGVHDVGIIPESSGGCPVGSQHIRITMDDEDNKNKSAVDGWRGAISHYKSGTNFEFCKVDGNQFGGHPGGDYAVLKLSDSCPAGSASFSRVFDNEHNHNNNSKSGDITPNQSTSATLMYFCFFPSALTMTSFPALGVPYGVFAAPSSTWVTNGFVYTDDEDVDNRDYTTWEGIADANRFTKIIYGSDSVLDGVNTYLLRGRNTYLLVAKVRD